jgi:hypothetical protein
VHAVALQLLPVDGAKNDTLWHWDGRRIARVVMPGTQASPVILEMAPCSVSVDSLMAACITYELPGSRLKLINLKGWLHLVFRRSRFPLAATAELHYRLQGGVGMFCEDEQRKGPGGICCVWYVISVYEAHCVRTTKTDATARSSPHPEEAHHSQCLRVLRRLWHSPSLVAKARALRLSTLAPSAALGIPFEWGSVLQAVGIPACNRWRKMQQRSDAVPLPPWLLHAAAEARHGGSLGLYIP